MKRTLLLNGDWQPLSFINEKRAICLILSGRAEVITIDGGQSVWEGEVISSPSINFPTPATIRLLTRINRKITSPRFRKKVMFARDGWRCQYCLIDLQTNSMTIDHVLPRSRGGNTSWKNCVTCCVMCNHKKGNKTPIEARLKLNKNPTDPKPWHFWEGIRFIWHDHWNFFAKIDDMQR